MTFRKFFAWFASFLLIVGAYWGVTFNPDWAGYEYYFETQNSPDFLYNYLSEAFLKYGYEFRDLYRFHIFFIALFFSLYFFRLVKTKAFFITVIFLLTNYVAVGTQIRYFMALGTFLLATDMYSTSKKHLSFLLLTALSLIAHQGIFLLIIMLGFTYVFWGKRGRQLNWWIVLIVNVILASVLLGLQLDLDSSKGLFNTYVTEGEKSSWIGGIYHSFPSIIGFICIFNLCRLLGINISLGKSKQLNRQMVLYWVSISPVWIIVASMMVQILGSRYLFIMLPLWLSFLIIFYGKVHKVKDKQLISNTFVIILGVSILFTYIMPYLLMPGNVYVRQMLSMILSYRL